MTAITLRRSSAGHVKAGFLDTGSQFCVTKGATKLWCADYPRSISGLNFSTNEACMQSDVSPHPPFDSIYLLLWRRGAA